MKLLKSVETLRIVKILFAVLAVGMWFSSYFVWTYYAKHRGSVPGRDGLRVFPLNTHGSVVYISSGERTLLYGLMIAGAICAFAAAASYLAGGRR